MSTHAAPSRAPFSLPRVSTGAAAVALAATALVGAGAYAAWTSTSTSTTGTQAAATVTQTGADVPGSVFSTAVSNLLPGDFAYRYRSVQNTGSIAQEMTLALSGSGALTAAGGLTVKVDRCADIVDLGTCLSWSPVRAAGAPTGSVSLGSFAPGATQELRYTLALPENAVQATFQGTTGTVTATITGATRAGQDRTEG